MVSRRYLATPEQGGLLSGDGSCSPDTGEIPGILKQMRDEMSEGRRIASDGCGERLASTAHYVNVAEELLTTSALNGNVADELLEPFGDGGDRQVGLLPGRKDERGHSHAVGLLEGPLAVRPGELRFPAEPDRLLLGRGQAEQEPLRPPRTDPDGTSSPRTR